MVRSELSAGVTPEWQAAGTWGGKQGCDDNSHNKLRIQVFQLRFLEIVRNVFCDFMKVEQITFIFYFSVATNHFNYFLLFYFDV